MTDEEREQWRLERRKQGAELLVGGCAEVYRLILAGEPDEAFACAVLIDLQVRAIWSQPPPWVMQ